MNSYFLYFLKVGAVTEIPAAVMNRLSKMKWRFYLYFSKALSFLVSETYDCFWKTSEIISTPWVGYSLLIL